MYNQDLYKKPYHIQDISKSKFLITGGAGFIGSNLVEYLLKYGAGHVRVLDNLSNGYYQNLKDFAGVSNFEFIQGDIRDIETCKLAVNDIDFISHQAALGSVPRSISDPFTTNEVNIGGFLNVLIAAKESQQLKSFVYAASSSTYGDNQDLPKIEGREGFPLSPYAVTKKVNELYAEVFSKIYGFHTTGLRYFNVFGPKQNPNNAYAAVIPIFCKSFIEGISPTIYGDGKTSRDFTFVENAVQANIRALFSIPTFKHNVYNVACGEQISLNEIIDLIQVISKKNLDVKYTVERIGDIKHSKASIEKISKELAYVPTIKFESGLEIVYNWYKENMQS
ncbi:MAG: SDR family oxidoreductase [Crocinitomicaceae bacterium]|nr:SDR family oxidoreductase [Crocinitomicaceae bacterium]